MSGMNEQVSRRSFLAAAGAGVGLAATGAGLAQALHQREEPKRVELGASSRPIVIASGNGREAARKAVARSAATRRPTRRSSATRPRSSTCTTST